jgi:hexokinase
VKRTLVRLVGEGVSVTIGSTENANLIGAAVAALS